MVFNGRLAEIVGQYLRKGSQVYVEGSLRTRKWTDQATGQERYATEIRADSMQMLGSRQGQGGGGGQGGGDDYGYGDSGYGDQGGGGAPAGNYQRRAPAPTMAPAAAPRQAPPPRPAPAPMPAPAPRAASGFDDMDDDIPF